MAVLTERWIVDGLWLVIGLITLAYFYAKYTYSYWQRKGFKYLPDFNYILGHFQSTLTAKEFTGDFITRIYRSTSEPFIGIYSMLRPVLVVRDPELIRSILIKDFQHFTERDVHCNEEYDPLSGTLFGLPTKKWKNLRGKLSPAFTSGKLKAMFSTLVECGSTLQSQLEKYADKGHLLDCRDLAARHTTNVIASVGLYQTFESFYFKWYNR